MSRPLTLALALVGASASAQPVTKSQPAAGGEVTALVARLGSDTVLVERYVRRGDRIEGDMLARTPSVQQVHYVATLAGDRVTQLEFSVRAPGGTLPPNFPQRITLRVVGDSVRREAKYADSTSVRTVAVPANATLSFGTSYAMYEQALRQLRASGQPSGGLLMYAGAPRVGAPLAATLVGRDSARVDYFGDPVDVAFDRAGRLVSWDGTRTTNKVVVRRVADLDVGALATAFAARPAMGQTSPRDTVRAASAGADLLVDYGRPSVRGRTVWGGTLVPFNAVWRTGANAATQLRTSRDLVIGGATVPAGTYTLWTWAAADGYQLIVNKQTGQWGTEYKAEQDLVRIPLTAAPLASPVEQFTVRIDPSAAGGTLRMQWADKELSVPFTVK